MIVWFIEYIWNWLKDEWSKIMTTEKEEEEPVFQRPEKTYTKSKKGKSERSRGSKQKRSCVCNKSLLKQFLFIARRYSRHSLLQFCRRFHVSCLSQSMIMLLIDKLQHWALKHDHLIILFVDFCIHKLFLFHITQQFSTFSQFYSKRTCNRECTPTPTLSLR